MSEEDFVRELETCVAEAIASVDGEAYRVSRDVSRCELKAWVLIDGQPWRHVCAAREESRDE
jgi:hypothetical protein